MMNYTEALKYYNELKKSGKLKEFQNKHPDDMTEKEFDLFSFDDGVHLYNPFIGEFDEVTKKVEYGELTLDMIKALGLLPGMKTKSYSEMTEEEKKLLSDY